MLLNSPSEPKYISTHTLRMTGCVSHSDCTSYRTSTLEVVRPFHSSDYRCIGSSTSPRSPLRPSPRPLSSPFSSSCRLKASTSDTARGRAAPLFRERGIEDLLPGRALAKQWVWYSERRLLYDGERCEHVGASLLLFRQPLFTHVRLRGFSRLFKSTLPFAPPPLVFLRPALDIRVGAQRRDGSRIDTRLAFTVVLLDMLELGRLLHPGHFPVQMFQPAVQARVIVSNAADHEFEMLLVDGVEADEGGVEFEVDFGDVLAEDVHVVWVVGKMGFEAVEGGEDDAAVFFIGGLGGGEAGFVDAVVEVGHHPGVDLVDLMLEVRWVKVQFALGCFIRRKVVVEGGVEHAHDILAFVVNDLVGLLVPEHGDRVFTLVFGIGSVVDLVQEFAVEEVVDGAARVFVVGSGEPPPASFFRVRFHDAHGKEVLQAFELAGQEYAMGERTEEGQIQVIAIGFWREGGRFESMSPTAIVGGWMMGHGGLCEGGALTQRCSAVAIGRAAVGRLWMWKECSGGDLMTEVPLRWDRQVRGKASSTVGRRDRFSQIRMMHGHATCGCRGYSIYTEVEEYLAWTLRGEVLDNRVVVRLYDGQRCGRCDDGRMLS